MALTSSSPSALPTLGSSKSDSLIVTTSSASRISSSALDSREAAATSRTSLGDLSNYSTSYPGESSNYIIGPNGVLSPRSSILRNPSNKKTFVDAWRPRDGSGPAVLQIQARQTARDREAEKEKERIAREKEIERELREMEQAEKVWGIPKKAFYMGLGDINFNAQMAILGGWGNGSGPATDFRPNLPSLAPRRITSGKVKTKREKEREKEKRQAIERAEERRKEKEKIKEDEEDSEDSIDAEELAALNAIINTRRSMEAASALASRNNRIVAVRRSMSQENIRRPSLADNRQASQESVQTAGERDNAGGSRSSSRPRPRLPRTSSEAQQRQSRIRFAPLPQAYNSIAVPSPNQGVDSLPDTPMEATQEEKGLAPKESPGVGLVDDASDTSDMDEPEECEDGRGRRTSSMSGSKSRWYLMGMPKSVFNPQTYRSSRRPRSSIGAESALIGELGSSPGNDRRGRPSSHSRMRRSASLVGSIKSRSSSVGSNDDDERRRRRQLIQASRPGGTGMVTLPDGTRIRARRVGEVDSEDEDFNEWGFAGLSNRRSVEDPEGLGEQAKSGDKRASDDERADEDMEAGSGMAWVKRRRREREESKQREAKAAEASRAEADRTEAEKPELPVPVKKPSDGAEQTKAKQATGLNALQAAEVRRRHEEEVAALGAEVLESIAKHKKGKQHPSRSATWDAGQPDTSGDAKTSTATQTTVNIGTYQHQKLRGRPRRAATTVNEEEGIHPSPSVNMRPVDAPRSSSPTQNLEINTLLQAHADTSQDGSKTPTGPETPVKGLTRVSSQLASPFRQQSQPFNTREQSPMSTARNDASTTTDAGLLGPLSKSPERETLPSSPPKTTMSPPQIAAARLTLSPSSSYTSAAPFRRRSSGPTSYPVPSPDLPRKPDSRGYAVVPLPIDQLGRRPERPREGRVWQFDDVDDDSDDDVTRQSDDEGDTEGEDESDSDPQAETKENDDDDDDEENTMNDEELAEEERRTAIQKKRATTRAAGAEMVSSQAKPNAAKLPRSPTLKTRKESKPSSPHQAETASASRKPIAIPVHKNRRQSQAEAKDDGSDISDDADLWPPTLIGTQLSRSLSGGEVVLSSSPGKDRRGSGASSHHMRDALSLAAHSAKARVVRDRKSKELKEKERLRALKHKEEQDLDYGWPKSLHGSSLYH